MTDEQYLEEFNRANTFNQARAVARRWHALSRWRRFWVTITFRRPKILLREFPTPESIGPDEPLPQPPWAQGFRIGEQVPIRGMYFEILGIGPAGMTLGVRGRRSNSKSGRRRVHGG